jgi:saccharopine dehydrogenase-like NADP-dependent oxidoreductase
MKRFTRIAIVTLIVLGLFTPFAMAADQLITAAVSNVKIAKDRNGAEYVRLMVETPKELNGVQYTTGSPAMAFGQLVAKAKTVKAGQTIKMIVSEKDFNGRTSYTVIKFLE